MAQYHRVGRGLKKDSSCCVTEAARKVKERDCQRCVFLAAGNMAKKNNLHSKLFIITSKYLTFLSFRRLCTRHSLNIVSYLCLEVPGETLVHSNRDTITAISHERG